MINLLPDNERVRIKKEYRLRLFDAGLVLLFSLAIVGFVVLLPTYLLSHFREVEAGDAALGANAASRDAENQTLLTTLGSANALATALAPAPENLSAANFVALIASDKTPGNSVTSLLYSKSPNGNQKITVQGVAGTRDDLTAFTQALEGDSRIASVNLPISDLAADSNVQFSFDVIAK